MNNLYEQLHLISTEGKDAAICTIVKTRGSTPRKVGAKMIVLTNGTISGTIGGGALEKGVIDNAINVIRQGEPLLFSYDLLNQFNMCCGGVIEIFIEPVIKKNKLYIFGGGHVGKALAQMALNLPFEVILIDDRKNELDQFTMSGINKMCLDYSQALPMLPFDDQTYVCIMTYSHANDRDILAYCLKKPHAYLGMIGSLRKVEITKKRFKESLQVSSDELEKVDMPMGLNIDAESPEEIAVSIMAKIIETKNKLKNVKRKN